MKKRKITAEQFDTIAWQAFLHMIKHEYGFVYEKPEDMPVGLMAEWEGFHSGFFAGYAFAELGMQSV